MDDAEKLRRNFAAYLAPMYLRKPEKIAEVCDEAIDRTGILLGCVREEAEKLKQAKETCTHETLYELDGAYFCYACHSLVPYQEK